uniref:Vesicular glutamate transporter 3 n=1 Tax=Lygus hesperus TaxID=30085 RepID=A0A0A9WSA8_LYGHE
MFSFMMRFFIAATRTLDDSKRILIVFTFLSPLWALAYLVLGAEGPDTSFLLSKPEHTHLAKHIGPRKKTRCSSKAPWKSILFGTILLYGWLIADFGRECSVTIIADGFQLGLDKFTDISVSGVSVGLCFAYISILGISVLSDKLIIKEVLTPGQVRKIYSSVGCCGASISMILAAYANRTSSTFAFIIVGHVFSAVMAIGQPVALFDISPNYAAVIFAIFSFLRTVLFASKVVIDVRLHIYPLTNDNLDVLFYRYGFLVFFTNLIFLLCGDIERKPFDTYDTHDWTKESIISYP